jgi:predicted transcriptional regulator
VTDAARGRPLGELEAAVMDLFWSADGSRVVRDVVLELAPQRTLAYTTVMTVMDNLHRKGFLHRERDGRAWRYAAALTRDTYVAGLMSDALSGSSDRAGALVRFAEQMDGADAEVLARALSEAIAERRTREKR